MCPDYIHALTRVYLIVESCTCVKVRLALLTLDVHVNTGALKACKHIRELKVEIWKHLSTVLRQAIGVGWYVIFIEISRSCGVILIIHLDVYASKVVIE